MHACVATTSRTLTDGRKCCAVCEMNEATVADVVKDAEGVDIDCSNFRGVQITHTGAAGTSHLHGPTA